MPSVEGLESLFKRLDKIENGILDKVEQALKEELVPVRAEVMSLTPVDTGALRRSIQFQTEKTSKRITASFGTYLEYGKYVEFGTSKMVAQPFLRPAFHMYKDQVKHNMKYRMRKIIREMGA